MYQFYGKINRGQVNRLLYRGCPLFGGSVIRGFTVARFALQVCFINSPLNTDVECTCHAILAACYQLAQSILKIGFTLAKEVGQGEAGGHSHDMLCTWWLSWLAVEKAPLPLQGLHFWHCRQFSVGRSVHWLESTDHCKLANEWAWQRS